MIDTDLLRQLGWSNELINEVSRIAEPMRQTNDKINTGLDITTKNYAVGTAIYVDQIVNRSSQVIKVTGTQ